MSKGGSHSSSQSQQQSQSSLDPAILEALQQNAGATQQFAATDVYKPLSASDIQGYVSPFISNQVGATEAAIDNQTRQQVAQDGVAAAASGAYDSTGRNVEDALTKQLGTQTLASTVSNLENEGYQEATQTAQTENTAANQFPIALRQLINQSLGLEGNPVLTTSSGSSSGSSTAFNFSLPAPVPAG